MVESTHGSSQEAWEHLNEYLACRADQIFEDGTGAKSSSSVISYDHFLNITTAWVDPQFDFGNMFGYTIHKWSKLINNYISFPHLDLIRSDIALKRKKYNNAYNLSIPFLNTHDSGKGCLLTLTFSKRPGYDIPILIANLRSSEVTKRLLFDLLLIQRMGEYVYGKEARCSIKLICPSVYLSTMSFMMYNTHRPLKKLFKKAGVLDKPYPKLMLELLHDLSTDDPEKMGYKQRVRAAMQLQRNIEGSTMAKMKPLLAGDLYLEKAPEIVYPPDCLSPSQRKDYKRELNKKKITINT